jgi:hypothetical protein
MREYRSSGECQPLPAPTNERGYIFGQTGSGKSVFCCKYAQEWERDHLDEPVYLISNIGEDPEIDKLPDLIRIPVEDVTEDQVSPQSVHDSLVIFDDIDAIPDKNVGKKIEAVRDEILTTGRHQNIYCLVTSHIGADFKHSRVPINESAFVVIFPQGGNWNQINRILKTYCGLSREQEARIKSLPSRWVMLHKSFPMYVVHEKGCYLV